MTVQELRTILAEEANRCTDAERLKRAILTLNGAAYLNGSTPGAAPAGAPMANSGDSGSMSREEFMRRLRGG